METNWTVGWGDGLTGPTTASVAGPCCGGRNWPFEVISDGENTIAILPDQTKDEDYRSKPLQDGSLEKRAAFIVRACNNHYKLLKALKAYVSKFGDCGDTYEHARQAIAEAEGQS